MIVNGVPHANVASVRFQGDRPIRQNQRPLQEHLTVLDQPLGRITACRIVLERPGERRARAAIIGSSLLRYLEQRRDVPQSPAKRLTREGRAESPERAL